MSDSWSDATEGPEGRQPRESRVRRLQGPILVLGASGFIGANLFRALVAARDDVHGTATRLPAWRLHGLPPERIHTVDLLIESNLDQLLDAVKPRTIFNCVAYGAYSFETDAPLIYQTNFILATRLLERLAHRSIACYVHAGSSSEYGRNSAAPGENAHMAPNSAYAVSKVAAAGLVYYYGRERGLPCANLRLYSVYGPYEDASRLIPNLVAHAAEGRFPPLVNPDISRDFVYVDDVTEAFLDTALRLEEPDYGGSFNIGTGRKTTIAELAGLVADVWRLVARPTFDMPARAWDLTDWFAKVDKARQRLGWQAQTDLSAGLARTAAWYQALPDKQGYERSSKKFGLDTRHSVTAIVACYLDERAIPIMYERLKACFARLHVDHEIVFVNDGSPDASEEAIRAITRNDRRVVGITHSRNFGSQAAFMSGLRIATKNACVLLDGDLQDPPELIEKFVPLWKQGYDVVYGRRVKREAPFWMRFCYKAFYRVFNYFSYVPVPHDAGDFALMDRRVVRAMLRFPERDLFLRGVRAFVGFRQTGVDYVRPERMFGRSTNSLLRNLAWAQKGILSFSNTPLTVMLVAGGGLLGFTLVLMLLQFCLKLARPDWAPAGITTLLLAVMLFGSLSVFGIGVLGAYLAKVFEEVKQRPLFVRKSIIRDGELRSAADELSQWSDP